MEKELITKIRKALHSRVIEGLNDYTQLFEKLGESESNFLDPNKISENKYYLRDYQLGFEALNLNILEQRQWVTPLIRFGISVLSEKGRPSPVHLGRGATGILALVSGTYKYDEDGNLIVDINDFSFDGTIEYNVI